MAFIGNTPISVAFLTDTFSGNGSTTAFTMTVAPANTSSIIVAITGVLQDPSTYSVSGTTLTFSAAPPTGTSNISVRYLGIPASGVTTTAYRTVTNFTATAGQTSFSVPSYTIGYIDVYRNGVRLVSTDYTATTGTTVVLNNACTVGDAVVTESFYVSSVLNAIPATAGSVGTSYLVDGSVTQVKLSTGVAGNGPAFSAYPSASQSIANTTSVLIQCDTKTGSSQLFDTAGSFNNTGSTATLNGVSVPAYSFAPAVAGYYIIGVYGSLSGATGLVSPQIKINTTFVNVTSYASSASYLGGLNQVLTYLNGTGDYVQFYLYQNSGASQSTIASRPDLYKFFGHLVRAA